VTTLIAAAAFPRTPALVLLAVALPTRLALTITIAIPTATTIALIVTIPPALVVGTLTMLAIRGLLDAGGRRTRLDCNSWLGRSMLAGACGLSTTPAAPPPPLARLAALGAVATRTPDLDHLRLCRGSGGLVPRLSGFRRCAVASRRRRSSIGDRRRGIRSTGLHPVLRRCWSSRLRRSRPFLRSAGSRRFTVRCHGLGALC